MTNWSNWSGRQTCEGSLRFARSTDDVRAIVSAGAANGQQVRVAGAGHSHYGLVPTDGVVLDLSGLSGVISADAQTATAKVWAGTPIYALGRVLHDAGLALKNQGDIDRQTIAGAVSTGTHGTGLGLQNLSAAVVGATLVLADGSVVECRAGQHDEAFALARLSLGAVGVVTQLTLSLREAYKLAESGWVSTYNEIRGSLEQLPEQHRHFEFFWYPHNDRVVAKRIDETSEPPEYPLAEEGYRRGWSYEVLPNHRPVRHTEMEFAVPLERAPECLDEVRVMLQKDFPELRWPVEYRTLAADDVWLSPAYQRNVATISVHQGTDVADEPLFEACEAIFRRYDGRPHWGKVHYYRGDDLARVHPQWHQWWKGRDQLDPDGVFVNGALADLRPG